MYWLLLWEEFVDSPVEGPQDVGSFTIILQKEGVTTDFPITGRVSVLEDLKRELEEDSMTRIH